MIIYEKIVEGVKHLFGTKQNIPSNSDLQLTYKDNDGDVITPTLSDTYVDGGSTAGTQYIARKSDGKLVNVFIGDECVIGKVTTPKVVKSIKVKTAPTKVTYTANDKLDLTGLVITATYSDGDKIDVVYAEHASDFTTTPANGATLTAADTEVQITYGGKNIKQAITVT